MTVETPVGPDALREEVRARYRQVALSPQAAFHFHTGRPLALRLGYEPGTVASLPDRAVESFAGVANPFSLRRLGAAERVVDIGSGAGFDSFVAASQVGPDGQVVGVDMTPEMLGKGQATAGALGLGNVEFRRGLAEALPVDAGTGRIGDVTIGPAADTFGGASGEGNARAYEVHGYPFLSRRA